MAVHILIGVSGCGKSSVGQLLAKTLNVRFIDADDFHPEANVQKMAGGIPLSDEDRGPWLDQVAAAASEQPCVVACSALKKSYRNRLRNQLDEVRFVLLNGSFELISQRMAERSDHFMPASLLQSQFDALEDPTDEEDVFKVTIDQTLEAIVAQIVAAR